MRFPPPRPRSLRRPPAASGGGLRRSAARKSHPPEAVLVGTSQIASVFWRLRPAPSAPNVATVPIPPSRRRREKIWTFHAPKRAGTSVFHSVPLGLRRLWQASGAGLRRPPPAATSRLPRPPARAEKPFFPTRWLRRCALRMRASLLFVLSFVQYARHTRRGAPCASVGAPRSLAADACKLAS